MEVLKRLCHASHFSIIIQNKLFIYGIKFHLQHLTIHKDWRISYTWEFLDDPYVPFLVVVVRWCHSYVYTYPCPPCVTGVHRHWFSPHRTWVDIDCIGVV